ncbi:MAG: aminotransferase class I/II-fold pyridoxal phosphate-dependent enzyme [Elusimicrobiota bacterium]
MGIERRKEPRNIIKQPVRLILHNTENKKEIKAELIDLSIISAKVICDNALVKGDDLDMVIAYPSSRDKELRLSATVDFIKDAGQSAQIILKFLYLNSKQKKELLNFISLFPAESDRRMSQRRRKANVVDKDRRIHDRRLTKPIFLKCVRYKYMEDMLRDFHSFDVNLHVSTLGRVRQGSNEFLDFASPSYLNMSSHALVKEAAVSAIEKFGVEANGIDSIDGVVEEETNLTSKLTEFFNKEKVLLFRDFIPALSYIVSAHDNVFIDELSMMRIDAASALSKGHIRLFKHNDVMDLKKTFKDLPAEMPKLIITDSVFSLEGDNAALKDICNLANDYKSAVMVDETYAIGILGKKGAGLIEELNISNDIDLVVGNFERGFGCLGGFIAGDANVSSYVAYKNKIMQKARPLSPYYLSILDKCLEVSINETGSRKKLWSNVDYIKNYLVKIGFNIQSSQSPIITIKLFNENSVIKLTQSLRAKGILIKPILAPYVLRKDSRAAIHVSVSHSKEDLQDLIDALKNTGSDLGVIKA